VKIKGTHVGIGLAVCQILFLGVYITWSFASPVVPHPDRWQATPNIEICERTNLTENNILDATAIIPGLFVEYVSQADLCLCDLGMQPLEGTIQITTGLPAGVKEPVVGLTQRYVIDGRLISACIYMPNDVIIAKKKIDAKTLEHVLRHELSHAYGYDHAYVLISDDFEESEPRSFHNWGIPAVGQLMTYDIGISGTSTKNMH
jgi:hypothetical protein